MQGAHGSQFDKLTVTSLTMTNCKPALSKGEAQRRKWAFFNGLL